VHTADVSESGEWAVIGHRGVAEATDPALSSTGKTYSVFQIFMMVQRHSGW
jgi:hypothetical protein